ncbi:hypothetical protein F4803DRAFT_549811 [Xylaria telfairii]|nr:hypothetical protein F4803DRAFT_549811 [Xylaria telfairii]
MVKKITKKGGKNARRGKRDEKNEKNDNRELLFKEDGQDYAVIQKILGSGRYNAQSFQPPSADTKERGVVRLAIRRGALRRTSIRVGDIVLLGLRDFQDGKADIIHTYTNNEAWRLQALGELPLSALRSVEEEREESVSTANNGNDDNGIIFGDINDDDENQTRVDIDAI